MGEWRRSSFCSTNSCIQVLIVDEQGLVNLSNGRQVFRVSLEDWSAFVAGVKAGEFDAPSGDQV